MLSTPNQPHAAHYRSRTDPSIVRSREMIEAVFLKIRDNMRPFLTWERFLADYDLEPVEE